MEHLFSIIIAPLFFAFFLLMVALVVGNYVLRVIMGNFFSRKGCGYVPPFAFFGISVLIGYGIMSYLSLLLSFFGPLNKSVILLCGSFVLLFGIKQIKKFFTSIFANIRLIYTSFSHSEIILLICIVGVILFYVMSVFVPPYRTDALTYHLPEAVEIASKGFSTQVGNSLFFGNLPLLMETLYSLAYCIGGYTVINLTHFFILLSGLSVLYNFIKNIFSRKAALFSVCSIGALYELFVDGTNAYVDAAATSFEIAGLVLFLVWLSKKETFLLRIMGMMYGFALATKYNALYGTLLAGIFVCSVLLVEPKNRFKQFFLQLLQFLLPMFLVAGFWYLKNFFVHGNPIFPFYFGHEGFSDAEYKNLVTTINLFELPRNIWGFLQIPFHFFLTSYYIPVFAATLSWPLAFWLTDTLPERRFIKMLSLYVLGYTILWFFCATHQLKFFFVPMVWIMVVGGIVAEKVMARLLKMLPRFVLIASMSLLVCLLFWYIVHAKQGYFFTVKKAEMRYIAGMDTQYDFYVSKNLSDIYSMSEYLDKNYQHTMFLNIWGSSTFFLSKTNTFINPDNWFFSTSPKDASAARSYMNNLKTPYFLIDTLSKRQSYTEPVRINNPESVAYRNSMDILENLLLPTADVVFETGSIKLYKIR